MARLLSVLALGCLVVFGHLTVAAPDAAAQHGVRQERVASERATNERKGANLAAALKTGEAFAIMRHAIAPGYSDPSGFEIGKCETQRNLSDEGRAQAVRIGRWFKDHGIDKAAVFTSQWCRCRETAQGLGLGKVRDLSALNSFFEARERRGPQTAQLKAWLAERKRAGVPLVLVTHQVNIAALTGQGTRSGETLIVRFASQAGGHDVVGGFVR